MEFQKDIGEIMYGLGEYKAIPQTIEAVQSVLIKQISMLLVQSAEIACIRGSHEISTIDIIFLLRKYKYTLNKIVQYYKHKRDKNTSIYLENVNNEEQVEYERAHKKQKKSGCFKSEKINDVANSLEDDGFNFNFTKSSTNIDYKNETEVINPYLINRKNTIYNNIIDVLEELNVDLEEYDEKIVKAHNSWALKTGAAMLKIEPELGEYYQKYKSKTFHDTDFLKKVLELLPWSIKYDTYACDIFQFLAKETISCLIFQVHQNRIKKNLKSKKPSVIEEIENILAIQIEKPITIEEITEITNDTWCNLYIKKEIPFMPSSDIFKGKFILD
ncbi:uncharacterized protein LOC126900166 [Daktulosphaira vitifoliae]|uniref:uncharacterized protein LOC126900166 n=1 Tax=Daktulosphaira vitifoliae TaxID=58002 RepID=UPI0021AACFA0|nr:uncharacterized protein LOC126900166 [Daktulosphaira vitifoliae]